MTLVPRRARKLLDPHSRTLETPEAEDLQAFRSLSAWVLLGEPGAGKTTVFQEEAKAIGGECLRIGQFINADIDPEWQGKTLFLDGLDEVRASSGTDSSVIELICRQIKRLGNPRFRIACRAADWYGSIDRDDLKAVSPDRQISVLLLQPLSHQDILDILRDNYEVEKPQDFIETAKKQQVDGLLDNPQTLGLLAGAVNKGNEWPETRDDTYRLACEKLAQEDNPRNRHKKRGKIKSVGQLLDAAGQISAVLLLSDKTGLAQDKDAADENFPELEALSPPDYETAHQALDTKLFRPEGEQRAVPSHRSIAEYLAARWLSQRINEGLPLGRVLNLLLGRDGRAVAGLRGLYAWLALHSLTAKTRLIESDPLTVVIYGDVKPMSLEDKRQILAGLRREAEAFAGFRQDTRTKHPFGALAEAGLVEDFRAILNNPERDEASQAHVECVLDILAEGEAQTELAEEVRAVICDETRWPRVRYAALYAWLIKLNCDSRSKLALLDDISSNAISDPNDQLASLLLRYLYPTYLYPKDLLRHLHPPKLFNYIGDYIWFWIHELPKLAPDDHLPILLDGLADYLEHCSNVSSELRIHEMRDSLLARGVTAHGDDITNERLFRWLGIGADIFGHINKEKSEYQRIADWLSIRPERYKALLALCFKQCEHDEHPVICVGINKSRLHNAKPPDDLGLWHLEQVSLTASDDLAQIHLYEAVNALINQRGTAGLSLETLEEWSIANPERKHWLQPMLVWDIPNRQEGHQRKYSEAKREHTIGLTPHLQAIRSGTARVDLLGHLARIWEPSPFDSTQCATISERFDNFCENGPDVLAAAEAGFRLCPQRTDLPTVDEIINLKIKDRRHFISLPCLIGMELYWQEDPEQIDHISDDTLRQMIAFCLADGSGNSREWFTHLAQERSALFSSVLIDYMGKTWKAGRDVMNIIYLLERDPRYHAVVNIAVSRLLEVFPVRARLDQLHNLERLQKIALHYIPESLATLIEKKTAMKGMDKPQKVYWLATATLLDSDRNKAALWDYIGKSDVLAKYFFDYLDDPISGLRDMDYNLSANTIGRLIELLTPHAEIERLQGVGFESEAERRGNGVRSLIDRLATMATNEAAQELDRLLGLPNLKKLKYLLENARHELRLKQRESEFRFLSPREVAQVLANREPASAADLAMLALDHLDTIAMEIRQDNDDGFRAFWNVWKEDNTIKKNQREENYCRDALLTRLRLRLAPLGIDCQPEGDYSNDKRADLRLTYRSELELPIEIKRDTNDELWTALKNQLINQYAISPRAYGYGIYLVLWFGEKGIPGAKDGGKKPTSPQELQARLEAQLDPVEKQRIFVRVLDVSWPKSNKTIIPAI